MTTLDRLPFLLDELEALYETSAENLRSALGLYLSTGEAPSKEARAAGAFAYPELLIHYAGTSPSPRLARAFALVRRPGAYAASLTRPKIFRRYLEEQLEFLIRDYGVLVSVGRSAQEIPYPYILDGSFGLDLGGASSEALAAVFPTTDLAHIGDEVVDGVFAPEALAAHPLSLFDAPRVDFSLARLRHYTGAPPEHVQDFVLFTNYTRYVDEFIRWGRAQVAAGRYEALSLAGNALITADTRDPDKVEAEAAWRRHQMPAYHLIAQGGQGVTLINIGVGPSNAKTITDHLAVLRPQAWLMIGHCGGLRPSQRIGDYVLAHAYLRDDHVLDAVLPVEIPIPPIAEVQQALYRAAETVSGETGEALKRRLRTGTVVTTDDRNWELRYTSSALRFSQSRAVGIDMESATIAAQGYRFRVPYGTLLCVSDKPLHGEIKLPGQANLFYEEAVSQHLMIGLEAIEVLRQEGPRLHSRKLRAFDEPPFR